MRIVHDSSVGSITVSDEISYYGIIDGNVRVANGGVFHLHGTVTKDLWVEQGGTAHLHGIVSGSVHNSGLVSHYGIISGHLHEEPGAITRIAEMAKIGKR